MKKKILGALLSVAMVATMLVGCGTNQASAPADDAAATEDTADDAAPADDAADDAAPAAEANGKKVGVAMPTQSSERWINDGANMKEQLEALG